MAGTQVEVRTRAGAVRGREADGVTAFKGMPYAGPPFGSDRFAPPRRPEPWDGVRDALEFGPTAPHPGYTPPYDLLLPDPIIPGEDCLTMNVWTPDPGGSGLPVMVWVHGGAFVNGSGAVPTYDGAAFARDGVVLVSFNYRLGVDGYLWFEGGTNNRGMLDQLAALEWVQENVAAFGGDPGNVTVFGESAGAMSIGALLGCPRADGLFGRAIVQSGAGHHAISPATARLVAAHLGARVGVEPTPEALAAIPLERLVEAQVAVTQAAQLDPSPQRWGEVAANLMAFEPVVDGDLLPELPIRRIASGGAPGVSVLAGTNTEEHRFFLIPNGLADHVTEPVLAMVAGAYGLDVDRAVATYRRPRPEATPGELLADVMTDWFFRLPAIRLCEARAAGGAPAHAYEFAWRSPRYGGRLGACHALELGFVFDNLGQPSGVPLLGEDPPQRIADDMHHAWIAFATSGDPGWPSYDTARRAVMRFAEEGSQVIEDPRAEERELWKGIR
jgi:para-nitrobenzyl esterase